MTIPPSTHPVWSNLISGKSIFKPNFLAAKILLARLSRIVELDNSPNKMHQCIEELRLLYANNIGLQKAQADLQGLFGIKGELP